MGKGWKSFLYRAFLNIFKSILKNWFEIRGQMEILKFYDAIILIEPQPS